MNIMDAQVPSQRWALPTDSKWDIHRNDYERWVDENYENDTQSIFGWTMTYDQAMENEELFDSYIEMIEEGRAEARAEDAYYDRY